MRNEERFFLKTSNYDRADYNTAKGPRKNKCDKWAQWILIQIKARGEDLAGTNVILIGLLILSACGSDNSKITDTTPAPSASSCTTAQAPRFSSVSAIFTNNCDNCHGHNFAVYSNANFSKNSIYSLVNSGQMPQNATLSQADKDAILQWVACGASN